MNEKRNELEDEWFGGYYTEMQNPKALLMNKDQLEKRIKIIWFFTESN